VDPVLVSKAIIRPSLREVGRRSFALTPAASFFVWQTSFKSRDDATARLVFLSTRLARYYQSSAHFTLLPSDEHTKPQLDRFPSSDPRWILTLDRSLPVWLFRRDRRSGFHGVSTLSLGAKRNSFQ